MIHTTIPVKPAGPVKSSEAATPSEASDPSRHAAAIPLHLTEHPQGNLPTLPAAQIATHTSQEVTTSLRAFAERLSNGGLGSKRAYAGMFAHILANNIAKVNLGGSALLTPESFVEIAQGSGIDGQNIVKLAHAATSPAFTEGVILVFARSMTMTPLDEAERFLRSLVQHEVNKALL